MLKTIGFIALWGISVASAATVPLSFTTLTGFTGAASSPGTAVFRADLSGVGLSSLLSITIADSNNQTGGSTGQFSGFDLDAVKLSYTAVASATDAAALAGLDVFNFSGGALFTPGTQRPTADAKLFGTGATGNTVNNSVATLGLFDGTNTTVSPTGFLSMGDGGVLTLNLTAGVSTTGLYLYIGEVGNQGEVAAGSITVSDTRAGVPDGGGTMVMLASVLAGVVALRRRLA